MTGSTSTRLAGHLVLITGGIDKHIERGLPAIPLGQVVSASEVAALAVHLVADESRSVTGSVFTIEAGRTAV